MILIVFAIFLIFHHRDCLHFIHGDSSTLLGALNPLLSIVVSLQGNILKQNIHLPMLSSTQPAVTVKVWWGGEGRAS